MVQGELHDRIYIQSATCLCAFLFPNMYYIITTLELEYERHLLLLVIWVQNCLITGNPFSNNAIDKPSVLILVKKMKARIAQGHVS